MSKALTQVYVPSFLPVCAAPAVLQAVNTVPELNTTGVILIQDGRVEQLRAPDSDGICLVVKIRPKVQLQKPYTPPVAPAPPQRHAGSSAAKEWISLGFNCGGAVLAWSVSLVLVRLRPSPAASRFLRPACSGAVRWRHPPRCGASVYRTYNATNGRETINDKLDADPRYVWTMRGLDVVGLVGAVGALKEMKIAHGALGEAGVGWRAAAGSGLSRPMRKVLTESLELKGAKRVSSA